MRKSVKMKANKKWKILWNAVLNGYQQNLPGHDGTLLKTLIFCSTTRTHQKRRTVKKWIHYVLGRYCFAMTWWRWQWTIRFYEKTLWLTGITLLPPLRPRRLLLPGRPGGPGGPGGPSHTHTHTHTYQLMQLVRHQVMMTHILIIHQLSQHNAQTICSCIKFTSMCKSLSHQSHR